MQRYVHDPKRHQRITGYMVKTCSCGEQFECPKNWRRTQQCPRCAAAAEEQRATARRETWRLAKEAGIPAACQRCGAVTESLTPHHKQPLSQGGGPELNNVEFLCYGCHLTAHRGLLTVGAWERQS